MITSPNARRVRISPGTWLRHADTHWVRVFGVMATKSFSELVARTTRPESVRTGANDLGLPLIGPEPNVGSREIVS